MKQHISDIRVCMLKIGKKQVYIVNNPSNRDTEPLA